MLDGDAWRRRAPNASDQSRAAFYQYAESRIWLRL